MVVRLHLQSSNLIISSPSSGSVWIMDLYEYSVWYLAYRNGENWIINSYHITVDKMAGYMLRNSKKTARHMFGLRATLRINISNFFGDRGCFKIKWTSHMFSTLLALSPSVNLLFCVFRLGLTEKAERPTFQVSHISQYQGLKQYKLCFHVDLFWYWTSFSIGTSTSSCKVSNSLQVTPYQWLSHVL